MPDDYNAALGSDAPESSPLGHFSLLALSAPGGIALSIEAFLHKVLRSPPPTAQSPFCLRAEGRVALGGCPPRAPSDPDVRTLAHPVPLMLDSPYSQTLHARTAILGRYGDT